MSDSSYSHNSGIRFKKRKARFTFSEVHILLDEVRKNRHIVVGKFNRGVPTTVKKRTWAKITACVNEIGECQREVIEVIKKWSDMKCDTKRKVAAIRAGAVPYKGTNSYLSRELSPIENIVHQILELDGKRGRLPTTAAPDMDIYSGTGLRTEEGDEEEEEDDIMLGIPSSYIDNSNDGDTDVPTISLPPHPLGMPVPLSVPMSVPSSVSVPLSLPMSVLTTSVPLPISVPTSVSVPMSIPLSVPMPAVSSVHEEDHAILSPVYCARSREYLGDTSHPHFEVQYEICSEDQELQQIDSDEECQEKALPPPNPAEDEHFLSSLQHVTTPASSHPMSSPSPSYGPQKLSQPGLSTRDKIAHTTTLSIQEQHNTNVLLETVSRSLELLSESVQQLAEIQQEFVQDSLQLQRETVHILRDFASGALALMHDKLNGRPAL
ncbi:hypothetical protein COCON_G00078940 [Conger conger]|uniref:Myb/SANT-like DNA-binding domain-containing protein n=1 Tax=Conger conger TaxID=82655 RepID=A0A9Q1I2D0_CONCO|nr:myb-related transcription factor, partner of profilin-like [Conger conger]XP_061103554.1 myb-related transcription factor, partner of profilin-like [Conger conger]KAJ8276142.1 hypothetical protein COCON_G00078940 [Conger conger]